MPSVGPKKLTLYAAAEREETLLKSLFVCGDAAAPNNRSELIVPPNTLLSLSRG